MMTGGAFAAFAPPVATLSQAPDERIDKTAHTESKQ